MWWFRVPTDQWNHTRSSRNTKLRILNIHPEQKTKIHSFKNYEDISTYYTNTSVWNCHLHHSTQMYSVDLSLFIVFIQGWLSNQAYTCMLCWVCVNSYSVFSLVTTKRCATPFPFVCLIYLKKKKKKTNFPYFSWPFWIVWNLHLPHKLVAIQVLRKLSGHHLFFCLPIHKPTLF